MGWLKVGVVDALETACRATQALESVPVWRRVYRRCYLARLSSELDHRWATRRWSVHDADGPEAWEEWFDALGPDAFEAGHWHAW